MKPSDVQLRDVVEADIEIFFHQQLDPEATAMAAFPARDHESHVVHWRKIMADPTCVTQAIVVDGTVAGNIGSWTQDGHREIGYWIGREYWGKGVASAAVVRLLDLVGDRPLFAYVAVGNAASVRVLEKAGFVFDRQEDTLLAYRIDA
jgi:RimJ/RimL family protein N-acetyltransferase